MRPPACHAQCVSSEQNGAIGEAVNLVSATQAGFIHCAEGRQAGQVAHPVVSSVREVTTPRIAVY